VDTFASRWAISPRVGRLGPAAIGEIGIGNVIFIAVWIAGVGLLFGLDTLVAQTYGAGGINRCQRKLVQGLCVGLMLSPPLMAVVRFAAGRLGALGVDPAVLRLAVAYLDAVWICQRQIVTTGILRGAGDTRTPKAVNVVPHWSLGLPVAAGLPFGAG
jgi:Na+-driven multidrug efflux pump